MNYSSTNAIVTVLVVMCTVMISTIYPAIKASRSANPGIQRSWRIGKPVGDLYDIVFPFTVSAYDITGVVSFLNEHFQNYSDSTLGVFATSSSHVFRSKCHGLSGHPNGPNGSHRRCRPEDRPVHEVPDDRLGRARSPDSRHL